MGGGGGNPWGSTIDSVSAGLEAVEGNQAYANARGYTNQGYENAAGTRTQQYGQTQQYLQPYSQTGVDALARANAMTGGNYNSWSPGANPNQTPNKSGQNTLSLGLFDNGHGAIKITPNTTPAAYGDGPTTGGMGSNTGTPTSGTDGATNTPYSFSSSDPSYAWRMQQGQQALERSAAARGQLLSGGHLKDLTNYSQGLASTEYGNQFNRLMGIASMGENAAGQQAGYSNSYGNALANQQIDQGQANAAASLGTYRNWQTQDARAAGDWNAYFSGGGFSAATGGK